MASVYKTLSKQTRRQDGESNGQSQAISKTRQKVLMLCSRGVNYRHRHLLADLHALMPHSRKESKLDSKNRLNQLNELAELYNCNNVLFFEARKKTDLYLWFSKPPNGPTIKMHCHNVNTMEELNFPGNCLKGSRPILSFDAKFDAMAHTRLIKEMLTHTFGVPKSSRKIKPFVDHVMSFTIADGRIWVRCYMISETDAERKSGDSDVSLQEIGPRFVLTPIVILEGSFGGPVIYENKEFVSPNQIRSDLRRAKAGRHNRRVEGLVERKVKRRELGLRTGEGGRQVDELDDRVLFA
ncbi:brix domain-containing protein 2 [Piedraia hortae CBS 480.64]|uniref:Brix domain-containing protein 2 n=1 Tax=Piedraia hortae CBS 480.64 TaxID=1314780 RepID=A0A6A7C3S2_9PEZI|nr:brix domain-containing protein 2 [Piedraia hortae CBS 480.64]